MTEQTGMINGHKVTVDHGYIVIDDNAYIVDLDGDHLGSIGIANPEVLKGTVLEVYVSDAADYEDNVDAEPNIVLDLGGQLLDTNGYLVDYDEVLLQPLGLIDTYEGMYGEG